MNPMVLILGALALVWLALQRTGGVGGSGGSGGTGAAGGTGGTGGAGGTSTGATGAGGSASTGVPGPCVSIQAADGRFVAAELGGSRYLTANRTAVGLWERFGVQAFSDGTVAFRAANGLYVVAELGGGRGLVASSADVGSWERFRLREGPGGSVAIETANGQYWRQDGGELGALDSGIGQRSVFRLTAVACPPFPEPASGGSHDPMPEPTDPHDPGPVPGEGGEGEPGEGIPDVEPGGWFPPSGAPDWTAPGVVDATGNVLTIDGAPKLWLGTTLFPLLWMFENDRDRLGDNLRWARDRGVDYVRALGTVGPSQRWEDRVMRPSDDHAGATDFAASFGLRVQWSLWGNLDQTPTRNSRRAFVDKMIDMSKGREDRIFCWEVANEPAGTGWDSDEAIAELREYAQRLRQQTPMLTAIGAAPDEAAISRWYRDSAADLLVVHLDRNTTGTCGAWRPVRQPWEVQFLADVPRAWLNNEPIGPQSSVVDDNDPWRLTMAAVYTWLCGGGAYCLHTGAGVRSGGAGDVERGRPANFWQVDGLDEALAGIAGARRVLSADLPNWDRFNVAWPGFPYEPDPIIRAMDQTGTLCRSYAARAGIRSWTVPIQIAGDVPFVARERMTLEVIDPMTGDTIDNDLLDAGQAYIVTPVRPALLLYGVAK